MSDILDSVHLFEVKLATLLNNYEFLRKENELLLKENSRLQILLRDNEQNLAQWKQEYQTVKIAKTIQGSTKGIRDTKLKINALIREIDKCIIQLNS